VAAAVEGGHAEGNVAELLKHVHVGKDLPKGEKAAVARAVLVNALYQAAEMTRQSGLLRDFARSGRVRIVTGIYNLESGRVSWPAAPARPGAPAPQR
jgi:carbonic anhydrase